jgi:hypothetical protein
MDHVCRSLISERKEILPARRLGSIEKNRPGFEQMVKAGQMAVLQQA